jgi:hypothetical protein
MICRPNVKHPPPMSRDIFSMGACVRIDPSSTSQGGIGFVTAVHTEERKVDVDYIQNSIGIVNSSPFITEARIHPHVYDPFDGGTNRSGHRRIEFGGGISNAVTPPPPPMAVHSRKRKRKKKDIYDAIEECKSWSSSTGKHPLLEILKEGKENKPRGWLRQVVKKGMKLPATPVGQLKSPERRLASRIHTNASALTPTKTRGYNFMSDQVYGWGVGSAQTIRNIDTRAVARKINSTQKERADAGTCVFTCESKRKQVYTAMDYYKRWIQHNNPGEPYIVSTLREEFLKLLEEEKVPYDRGAVSLRQKVANAPDGIGKFLRKTNGSISWSMLSEKVRGDGVLLASKDTMRTYVMSLSKSIYQST